MDNRLIENTHEFKCTSDQLKALTAIAYNYKGTPKQGIGIEAQELEKLLPVLVKYQTNAPLLVDYEKLSVVLLAVVQELAARIEALENNKKTKKNK